ncbi:hypothetical protein V6N11_069411 [Hibiscus sabdariffa]|uniref:Uncharacterized protein n=1 Tax=Hibiscus sabdariffa TaxID=183260 RepID=A0ABR1ZPT3_9ROSI
MVCIPENVLQCRTFWGAVVPLIHSTHRGRFDENWTVKQANFILVWEERHTPWAEDLSPLQAISVEVGNKWREDPRCSKHRQLTSEFGQSFEEPTDEPNFEGWPSSWNSVEDSSIHVSNNPWEQPSFGYVSEQPPMYGGSSSSQPVYTDDGGYIHRLIISS